MVTCPTCHQPATSRDGRDHRGQQRYSCRPCRRDFTATSASAFSGYRWPADIILTAVRWYLSYPIFARQVTELLAERGVDVSARTVLTWTQVFGPQLALQTRRHRRRPGRRWWVDEVFLFRGAEKRYLYRAIDEHGQVVDVLLREHRDLASAEAFFRRAIITSGQAPAHVITDRHQPYVKAVERTAPRARHIRTGLHRWRGETTKSIERSHAAIRDRLRPSRGLKDDSDRAAVSRGLRSRARLAAWGCAAERSGAGLPSRTGHTTRAGARGRRGHQRPGGAPHQEQLRLRFLRLLLPTLVDPRVSPNNFADSPQWPR
jgi:transposase-like protein